MTSGDEAAADKTAHESTGSPGQSPARAPGTEDELRARRTMNDRVIGAAVGITMTRYGMSYPDASTFLDHLAVRHRRGLLDLARTITTSRWPTAESFEWARDGSPVGRLEQTADESAAGRLLDLLIETPDLNDLLRAAADLAVESLPGCDYASITVIRDGAPATVAASDERATAFDELQYSHGQGPCLQAARTDAVVHVPELASSIWDIPWKDAAAAAGIQSVLALPIASDADIAAALNLFSTRPGTWPSSTQTIGEELALYIGSAITLAHRRVKA